MNGMSRRGFLGGILGATAGTTAGTAKADEMKEPPKEAIPDYDKWQLSDKEWKERLSDFEYQVLRKEATERAGTSPLNDEKRAGIFHCAGCELPLFDAATKYDSGTGWPSFFDKLPNALGFKTDFKIGFPRKEYHCARCGGHQGHVFNDGPLDSTGLRYCNNGIALKFVPADDA